MRAGCRLWATFGPSGWLVWPPPRLCHRTCELSAGLPEGGRGGGGEGGREEGKIQDV